MHGEHDCFAGPRGSTVSSRKFHQVFVCVACGLHVQGIGCHRSNHDLARSTHLIVPTLGISYTRIQQAASDTIRPHWRTCNRLFIITAPLFRHPGDKREQQSIFAREVMQQAALADAGLLRNRIKRERTNAVAIDHDFSCVENRIACGNFGVAVGSHSQVYRLAGRSTNRPDGLRVSPCFRVVYPCLPGYLLHRILTESAHFQSLANQRASKVVVFEYSFSTRARRSSMHRSIQAPFMTRFCCTSWRHG